MKADKIIRPQDHRLNLVPDEKPRELTQDLENLLRKKPYHKASRLSQIQDTVMDVKGVKIGGQHRVMMAGPCSVESRDQIFACAKELKAHGGQILRGGCYKPRSSPYAFQGLGEEGLIMLRDAGAAYQLPVISEVMAVEQIPVISKYCDVLQVGARNMQNFDLLKALGKLNKPVMLKRGLSATVDEWLASAEYIMCQGNSQVILCERGIRTFENSTRNTLDLSSVLVAQERSHLPVMVDPSHAAGHWQYIEKLAKAALAMDAQGVMVEFHPNPQSALSDGPQSLNFKKFGQLMEGIRPWIHGERSMIEK